MTELDGIDQLDACATVADKLHSALAAIDSIENPISPTWYKVLAALHTTLAELMDYNLQVHQFMDALEDDETGDTEDA